jgi:iron complex outermembrane receptor protein
MRYLHAALGATALALVLAAPALAQKPANVPPSADELGPAASIETVTVTARRRAEDVERVPLNVSELSGDDLRQAGIKTATDLQTFSPTLTVAGTLGSRDDDVFNIRGQGQDFGGADPGVQTYFSEVPFGGGGPGNYYDMANVQVLSGPQGTLFGRSTTGGAVLFEPRHPEENLGGYLDGQMGNYDFRELQGAANIPVIADKLLVRGAFDIASRDGFTKDTVSGGGAPTAIEQDDLNYQAYRLGITWRPSSRFENYALFSFFRSHTHGTSNVLTGIAPEDELINTASELLVPQYVQQACMTSPPPGCVATGTAAGEAAASKYVGAFYPLFQSALATAQGLGPRATTSSIVPLYRRQVWEGVDIAHYEIDSDLTVRNIFGYLSDKTQSGFDYDGSSLPLLDIPNARTWETQSLQVTDEVQLLGTSMNKTLEWILGYYHELDHPGGYGEVERNVFGGGAVDTPLSSTEINSFANGGHSDAVYLSATWDAAQWLKGLSLTAGGRYTWDHKRASQLTCIYAVSSPATSTPCPQPLTAVYAQPTLEGDFRAPNWTLAANYQVTDDTMVYATYRRGYKSGGFNSGVTASSGFADFQPEYLTDVEVGSKNNWTILGTPGRTNFDFYYGWYKNIQKNDLIDVDSAPSAITLNAARAAIKGLDFQSTIVPNDHLEVTAFYSYTDASYGTFSLPTSIFGSQVIGNLNHAGNPFAYTPVHKAGITANVHFRVPRDLGVPSFSVTWYHQSREWFTDLADLEPDGSQAPYDLLNMRLDWTDFMNRPVDLAFFVNNVTDALYKVGGNPIEHLTATSSSIYAPPRMWGVELRYRFGADAED